MKRGLALPLLFAGLALAAEVKPLDAKTGLWESVSTLDIEGMPQNMAMPQLTPDQLAKMPAAQRTQYEEMMKKGGSLNGPRTSRHCATKESLADGLGMGDTKQANCARQIVSASSSKTQVHVECSPQGAPNIKSVGDITMERVDSEHLRGNMTMTTTGGPKPMNMKMTFTSKWISADCGDVKPSGAK